MHSVKFACREARRPSTTRASESSETKSWTCFRPSPSPDGFRAFVCDATFDTYKQAGGASQYVPVKSYPGFQPTDVENMKVWRIEFSSRDSRLAPGAPASPDTPPQSGPLPAPQTDVFGPWFVTGALGVGGLVRQRSSRSDPGQP